MTLFFRVATICTTLWVVFVHTGFGQTASFTASIRQGCSPLIVNFDGTSSTGAPPLTYIWDFGNSNGTTGSNATPGAVYSIPGDYVVRLTVVDQMGNRSAEVTTTITVFNPPTANIQINSPSDGCIPLEVSFSENSTIGSSPIANVFWAFGDGTSSTQANPLKTYNIEGVYDVQLIVRDGNGCQDDVEAASAIRAINPPEVAFSASPTNTCNDALLTNFTNQTTFSNLFDPGYTFLWDFGDGTTTTMVNPSKIYDTTGVYDISLTVTAGSGFDCETSLSMPGFIKVGAPEADFVVTVPDTCQPQTLRLRVASDLMPSYRFDWAYGDGNIGTGTLANPTLIDHLYTYNAAGNYQLRLTVTDTLAPTCPADTAIFVSIPEAFDISFTDTIPVVCQLPLTVDFMYTGDSATNIAWEFGDGGTSTLPNPAHAYTAEGRFNVRLTVTDTTGCTYTLEREVEIQIDDLVAMFETDGDNVSVFPEFYSLDTALIAGGCTDDIVNFRDISTTPTPIASWVWDFDDGTPPVSTPNGITTHLYTAEGVYSPTLTVTTVDGCTESFQCTGCVIRGDRPSAILNIVGDSFVCCGYDALFENLTDTATIDLVWYTVSTGDTQGFVKLDSGGFGDSTNFRYIQMLPAEECGSPADVALYTYNMGCLDSVEVEEFQVNHLPFGNGNLTPNACVQTWQPGGVLDFNDTAQIMIDWEWPSDGAVDRLEINFDVNGGTTQCGFTVNASFDAATDGSLFADTNNCAAPAMPIMRRTLVADSMRANNQLPIVNIPSCFVPDASGYELTITVFDDTSPRLCSCEVETVTQFNVVINPNIEVMVSSDSGCSPLSVDFNALVTGPPSTLAWDIFSGPDTISATGDTISVTLTEGGDYFYRVTATTNGCVSDTTFADSIQVYDVMADFSLSSRSPCLSDSALVANIQLTDSTLSRANIVSREWQFANGVTRTGNDSIISESFTALDVPPGALQQDGLLVSLTATDEVGCRDTASDTLFLRNPMADFGLSVISGCLDTVILSLSGNAGIGPLEGIYRVEALTTLDTTLVDELMFDSSSPQRIGLLSGQYRISLTVTADRFGTCVSTTSDTVLQVVSEGLRPGFSVNQTDFPCPPAQVEITDTTTHGLGLDIVSWNWVFEDDSLGVVAQAAVQNPTQIFQNPGNISVSLTVQDEIGCEKTIRFDSLIMVDGLQGTITLPSDTICVGVPATFTATATNADQIIWDFGDGNLGQGESVQHAYIEPGLRIPSIILEDNGDVCSFSLNDTLSVFGPPMFDLGIGFDICNGDSVVINSPFDNEFNHLWSTGATDTFIVANQTGMITLDVSDTIIGCSLIDTVMVSNNQPPQISIEEMPTVCTGDSVTANANIVGETGTLLWLADGDSVGNTLPLRYLFNRSQVLTLTATSTLGCVGRDTSLVSAVPRPLFDLQDIGLCPGDSAVIDTVALNTTFNSPEYTWFFNDSLVATGPLPELTLSTPGTYRLEVSVGSCVGFDSTIVAINPFPDTGTNDTLVVFCVEDGPTALSSGQVFAQEWLSPISADTPEILVDRPGVYQLRIFNEFGCAAIDSIRLSDRCPPRVYIPEAFTPNADGQDDFFQLFFFRVGDFELLIFNRWGEVIFFTEDKTEFWDGRYLGQDMPSGTYPYLLSYQGTDLNFKARRRLQGKVTLIK